MKIDIFKISQPCPKCILSLKEESEKKALKQFKHVIKICLNRGHVFQNKLRNTGTAILKMITKLLQNKLTFSTKGQG